MHCTSWFIIFLLCGSLTPWSSLGQVIEDRLERDCYPREFQCKSGDCIKMKYVCNNVSDCPDSSDEPLICNVDRCMKDELQLCSHKCISTSDGFQCACNKGYKLSLDQKTCEDVNECIEPPAKCSQTCWNTIGSYNCKCDERFYKREPDGHTCTRVTDQQPWVLYGSNHKIEKIATDGSEQVLLDEDIERVVALDSLYKDDMIYYSDTGKNAIYRAKANGSEKEEVIVDKDVGYAGLSVDWVGNKIYWFSTNEIKLSVAELDGTNHKIIKNDNIFGPRALAVHPGIAYVYFTDWHEPAFIGRIGMDGSKFSHILNHQDKVGWPNALNIDFFADRIYWGDSRLDQIAYSDLEGKNSHIVLRGSEVPHVFAITVFDDNIYWTDWRLRAILKANKFTGENLQILQNTTRIPYDIEIYHPLRQPPFENPCGDSNGGCSHLCLLSPKDDGSVGYTCACPSELYMDLDNKTCVVNCTEEQLHCEGIDKKCIPIHFRILPQKKTCGDGSDCIEMPAVCSEKCWHTNDSYNCKCDERFYKREPDGHICSRIAVQQPWVIYANYYNIKMLATDGSEQVLIDGSFGAVALDFLYKEGMIYYSDERRNTICRVKTDGSEKKVIVNETDVSVSLSVDWVGNKLYWLSQRRRELYVTELNGTNHKILKDEGLSMPKTLAVHPGIGYVYFVNVYKLAYIGRIGMDGSNFSHIFNDQDKVGLPNALSIDFVADRIYWSDVRFDYIAYSDLEGKNYHEILRGSEVPQVSAITVFEDYIYWADWYFGGIFKADKFTGQSLQILQNTSFTVHDIQIYHSLRQPSFKNPCGDSNGGCSHLCLLSPKDNGIVGYTCACPSELYLDLDKKTCIVNCTEKQFHCEGVDKKCIPLDLRCDGVNHCEDGSDEPSLQICEAYIHQEGLFWCDDTKRSIPHTWVCDGEDDCIDGSDENSCHMECTELEFKCKLSGKCIRIAWKCDGDEDCRDGSDEGEDCAETTKGGK